MNRDECSKNCFEVNSQLWHGRHINPNTEQGFASPAGVLTGCPNPKTRFNSRFHPSRYSYPSQNAYSQRAVFSQQHRTDRSNHTHKLFENNQSAQMKIPVVQQIDSTNSAVSFPALGQMKSFQYIETNSMYSRGHVMPVCHQSQILPHLNLNYDGQSLPPNNVQRANEELTRNCSRHVEANNLSLPVYLNQNSAQSSQMPQLTTVVDQEATDKLLIKQWLEQRDLQHLNEQKPRKTLKVSLVLTKYYFLTCQTFLV